VINIDIYQEKHIKYFNYLQDCFCLTKIDGILSDIHDGKYNDKYRGDWNCILDSEYKNKIIESFWKTWQTLFKIQPIFDNIEILYRDIDDSCFSVLTKDFNNNNISDVYIRIVDNNQNYIYFGHPFFKKLEPVNKFSNFLNLHIYTPSGTKSLYNDNIFHPFFEDDHFNKMYYYDNKLFTYVLDAISEYLPDIKKYARRSLLDYLNTGISTSSNYIPERMQNVCLEYKTYDSDYNPKSLIYRYNIKTDTISFDPQNDLSDKDPLKLQIKHFLDEEIFMYIDDMCKKIIADNIKEYDKRFLTIDEKKDSFIRNPEISLKDIFSYINYKIGGLVSTSHLKKLEI
jgi:hypothetical protein